MNTAIVIAASELRGRSRLFIIALSIGLVPFAAALAVQHNRQLAIATAACILGSTYAAALAVALGISTIGNELTERRLSYLFSKPVSAASIWIGKATAGVLTWLGAFVIIILPAYVLARDGWRDNWDPAGRSLTIATLAIGTLLFFGSHAASTMFRSRSARVGIDFVFLCIIAATLFVLLRPILLGGGVDLVIKIIIAVSSAMLLLLAVVPVWQLTKGRVDVRASHAALSNALWSGMAVVMIVAASYAIWVVSPSLSSITEHFVIDQSPSSRWVYMAGMAPGRGSYQASFLVDTATGERERLAVTPFSRVHYSPDGRMIAWMESDDLLSPMSSFRLHTRRLEPGAKQVATQIVGPRAWASQLSHDGSRFAVVHGRQLEVYETDSGRQLAVTQGLGGDVRSLLFLTPDVVQVVEGSPRSMTIREFDVVQRRLATTVERPLPTGHAWMVLSADGSRLFLRREATVIDTHTGATVATLPMKADKPFFATMLRDGSLIVTRDSKLIHLDRSGTVIAEMPIPVPQAAVVGQIGSTKVVLGRRGNLPRERRMFVIDLAAHKVERTVDGVLGPVSSWFEPVLPQFAEDTRFIGVDSSSKLVTWDARTGVKRPFPS